MSCVSLMKNSHSTLNLRPHFFLPPFLSTQPLQQTYYSSSIHAPQSSILIMKPTTPTHRNFRNLYSQPNIQFISYQDLHLHLQIHHQNQIMARTSSMPPPRNDDKKRHTLYTLGSQANIQFIGLQNFNMYILSGLSKWQEGMDGWIDLNIKKNDNNKKESSHHLGSA